MSEVQSVEGTEPGRRRSKRQPAEVPGAHQIQVAARALVRAILDGEGAYTREGDRVGRGIDHGRGRPHGREDVREPPWHNDRESIERKPWHSPTRPREHELMVAPTEHERQSSMILIFVAANDLRGVEWESRV